jgi:hypothetical protein
VYKTDYICSLSRSIFVNIWVVSFAFLSQLIYHILPGRQPLEFHLCTGTNPLLESNEIKINFTLYGVFILSAVLNVTIPIKIRRYQIKNKPTYKSFGNEGKNTSNISISLYKAVVSNSY